MHKILVVDDEEHSLRIMKILLELEKFEFIGANGGEATLKILLADENIDLMIIDMKMPGMNGLEVAKRIRDMGRTFPIIFQTANLNFSEDKKRDLGRIGVEKGDILLKPLEFSDVLAKLKEKMGISNGR